MFPTSDNVPSSESKQRKRNGYAIAIDNACALDEHCALAGEEEAKSVDIATSQNKECFESDWVPTWWAIRAKHEKLRGGSSNTP